MIAHTESYLERAVSRIQHLSSGHLESLETSTIIGATMSDLIDNHWLQHRSHPKDLSPDSSGRFPVGVEYYRPPVPPADVWDQDFQRIRAAGMQIVRTFYPWNWVETEPERYELDDLDRMFELAARHRTI